MVLFNAKRKPKFFGDFIFLFSRHSQLVVLYVDFKLDESYTPCKISIRAGDGFHNLKVICLLRSLDFVVELLLLIFL